MDKLWCWYDSGTCCPCPPRQFAADPHNQERWTVHKSSPGAVTLAQWYPAHARSLSLWSRFSAQTTLSDTSMFWFSGSCVSPISVWGMLLLCSITFALDLQVFFHPVFRSQENKLENIEKLGRLNIFWIWNIFGPDHLIFFTVLLRSRNWTATESCKLELETRLGTGFA